MCCNTPLLYSFFIHHKCKDSGILQEITAHQGTQNILLSREKLGKKITYKSFKSRLNPYIVPWFVSPSINTKQLQLVRRELNLRVAEQMEKQKRNEAIFPDQKNKTTWPFSSHWFPSSLRCVHLRAFILKVLVRILKPELSSVKHFSHYSSSTEVNSKLAWGK